MSFEEACQPPRLHDQRDPERPADRRDRRSLSWQGRYRNKDPSARLVERHLPRTHCACFVPPSLRARFEFDIAPETVEICQTIDVTDLPKERIWAEIEKLLLKARRAVDRTEAGFTNCGVVDQIFPELQSLVGVPQEPEWHPEGDVDVHTMMVADEARKLIDDLAPRNARSR